MNLNYQTKTGFEICKGSGSERWVSLRRYTDGEFETLFIARFKYMRPGTKATAYVKKLIADLGDSLQTITQEALDQYRASINEQEAIAFRIKKYGTADKLEAGRIAAELHVNTREVRV